MLGIVHSAFYCIFKDSSHDTCTGTNANGLLTRSRSQYAILENFKHNYALFITALKTAFYSIIKVISYDICVRTNDNNLPPSTRSQAPILGNIKHNYTAQRPYFMYLSSLLLVHPLEPNFTAFSRIFLMIYAMIPMQMAAYEVAISLYYFRKY